MERYSQSSDIYMHREVLVHSIEGREMEMITLSSYKGILVEREPSFEVAGMLNEERPYKF
jgi:hypothetical protein